jgi:hypothetical protein
MNSEYLEEKTLNDLAQGTFVSHWPNWLRWVLVLPTSLIGCVVLSTMYLLIVSLSGFMMGYSSDGFWWQLMSSMIIGGSFVYLGAFMSPRYQFVVAIFLLVILSIIATILFTFSFSAYSSIGPIEYGIHTLAILLAGIYAIFSVKNFEK